MTLRSWLLQKTAFAALAACHLPLAATAQKPDASTGLQAFLDAKRQISASLKQLPNLTCELETRRAHFGSKAREKIAEKAEKHAYSVRDSEFRADIPLDASDSLALEIALIGGKELYAFPESPRFEERPLEEMIGYGTVSTGAFSGHASNVFVNDAANIHYIGEESLTGRAVRRYDYEVPGFRSGYTLTHRGVSATVPWHGSFWLAVEDDGLERLTVVSNEIPPALAIARVATEIDYHTVTLETGEYLLPREARLLMLFSDETESVSITRFHNCKGFVGSSTLSFDDETARFYASRVEELDHVQLPGGLTLRIELTREINSDTAQVGTPVEAELTTKVKYGRGLVIPRGAVLRGRLRRMDFYQDPRDHYVVGIEFTQLRFDDKEAPLRLVLSGVEDLPAIGPWHPTRVGGRTFPGKYGIPTVTETTIDIYRSVDLPGVGAFYVHRSEFRLAPGFDMTWHTVDPDDK